MMRGSGGPSRASARPSSSAPRPSSRSAGCEQQALARPVHELQPRLVVEGEHGHVHLLHDPVEQGGGLDRAQALLAQGLADGIDLQHDLAQGVDLVGQAGAQGEVPLVTAWRRFDSVCSGRTTRSRSSRASVSQASTIAEDRIQATRSL